MTQSRAEPPAESAPFGRVAVWLGYITREQLDQALCLQQQGENDRPALMSQILLRQRWIDAQQIVSIMRVCASHRLACPACDRDFKISIEDKAAGLPRCGNCGVQMTDPVRACRDQDEDLREEQTVALGLPTDHPERGDGGEEAPVVQRTDHLPPSLGRYRVLLELGRGGMGVVLKAHDPQLGRMVAIKLLPQGSVHPRSLQRFQREAQATANLRHPNMLGIHEFGIHEGRPYYVMDLVEGGSLLDRIQSGNLTLETGLAMIERVAEAMGLAHDHGVIHRDLKPANILINGEGTPFVTDFGLARLASRGRQTRTGAILGTPRYMAPEQIAGDQREIDQRCDVFALGVMLYWVSAGQLPFDHQDVEGLFHQILCVQPIPPRRHRPSIPRDLEAICLKALEKDQSLRYATAGMLAQDLSALRQGLPVQARRVGPLHRTIRRLRRHPLLLAVCSAACLGLLLGAWGRESLLLDRAGKAVSEGRLDDASQLISDGRRWSVFRGRAFDLAAAQVRKREVQVRSRTYAQRTGAELENYRRLLGQLAALDRLRLFLGKGRTVQFEGRSIRSSDVTLMKIELRGRLLQAYHDALSSAAQALDLDPDNMEARRLQQRVYEIRLQERIWRGDIGEATWLSKLISKRRMAHRLPGATGTVRLATTPPAKLAIYRYREEDKRLVWEGAPPVYEGVSSKQGVVLPVGRYLAVFKKSGYAVLNYPFLLRIGETVGESMALRKAATVPSGFALVSRGTCHVLGEPDSHQVSVPLRVPYDFLMSTGEVTQRQYAKFLTAFRKRYGGVMRTLLPQPSSSTSTGPAAKASPASPAESIPWVGAMAYMNWKNEQDFAPRQLALAATARWSRQHQSRFRKPPVGWQLLGQKGSKVRALPRGAWRQGGLMLDGTLGQIRLPHKSGRHFALELDLQILGVDESAGPGTAGLGLVYHVGGAVAPPFMVYLSASSQRPLGLLGWHVHSPDQLRFNSVPVGRYRLPRGKKFRLRIEVVGHHVRILRSGVSPVGYAHPYRPAQRYRRRPMKAVDESTPLQLILELRNVQLRLTRVAVDRCTNAVELIQRYSELGGQYRLPTEAEWARASLGEGLKYYPWGMHWDSSNCNNGWRWAPPERSRTRRKGSYPRDQSPFGIFDTAGSLSEWLLTGGTPRYSLRVLVGGNHGHRAPVAWYRIQHGQVASGALVHWPPSPIGFRPVITLPRTR